jgi:hypothetical protein
MSYSLVRRAIARALIVFGVAAALCLPSTASATNYYYCQFVTLAGFDHCDGPQHSLTANQAWNSQGAARRVCAGALLNGAFYGSYACGDFGFAEHCYSGQNLLTPRIHNGESLSQGMYGRAFYSETCP